MKNFILLLTISILISGCRGKSDDSVYSVDSTTESAQQVSDAMTAIDESGGSTSGAITLNEIKSFEKAFARMSPNENSTTQTKIDLVLPKAQAAACNTIGFDTCSSTGPGKKVRTFSDCTTAGNGTISGNVTLSFTGSGSGSCTIPANTDSVSRVPNYTISGVRGATFVVSAPSTGQTMTRTGVSTMTMANAGIQRIFTTPKGTKLLDVTTSTGTALTINGNARSGRTISGGTMVITNNLTSTTCTLTATSIAWTAGCSCPTAGNWSGTCTDSTSLSVAYGSTCGDSVVTKNSVSNTLSMDRCQ